MASDDLNTWKTDRDFEGGKIVAEIETNGEYSDLELIDGHSDLTITFDGTKPPPKQWTAKMTPGLTTGELEITRFTGHPCCPTADAYPGVTRLDYTTFGNNNNHVIGVKCADGWCEIGRTVHYQNPHSSAGTRQRVIKGYFDEQRLAVPDGSPGRLKPWKATVATIFPTPELETYTDPEQFRNKWLHVASIKSPDMYDKLKLKKHNTIESEMYLTYFSGTRSWWALVHTVDEASGTVQESLFKVKRVEHTDAIPPVVRWGWEDDDESVWVRCANGCCQIEEYDSVFAPTIADTAAVAPERCTAGKPCYRVGPRNAAARSTT